MKTNLKKGNNIVHVKLVKKAELNMIVYSPEVVTVKTDAKLNKAEKEQKAKTERKNRN